MFFPVKRTVFSDGDVPQIDVSPVVSNRNQENRWLKIMIDTMDYTNIYQTKNPNDTLKPKADRRWWRPGDGGGKVVN